MEETRLAVIIILLVATQLSKTCDVGVENSTESKNCDSATKADKWNWPKRFNNGTGAGVLACGKSTFNCTIKDSYIFSNNSNPTETMKSTVYQDGCINKTGIIVQYHCWSTWAKEAMTTFISDQNRFKTENAIMHGIMAKAWVKGPPKYVCPEGKIFGESSCVNPATCNTYISEGLQDSTLKAMFPFNNINQTAALEKMKSDCKGLPQCLTAMKNGESWNSCYYADASHGQWNCSGKSGVWQDQQTKAGLTNITCCKTANCNKVTCKNTNEVYDKDKQKCVFKIDKQAVIIFTCVVAGTSILIAIGLFIFKIRKSSKVNL